MRMADISVDLDMLRQTSSQLNILVNDFKNAATIVSNAKIGDPTIDGALGNFTSDWSVKVGDLVSSMQSVQKMASQGVQGYTTTDNKLASDLKKGGSQ
jgi:hypothetical protein